MLEMVTKVGVFLVSSAVISSITTPVCDKLMGEYSPEKEDFRGQALVRGGVAIGNVIASAVIASTITTALFEEPEAIIEVASEFI